jgi:hypothetical protein
MTPEASRLVEECKRLFREAMHLSAHDSPTIHDPRATRVWKIVRATDATDAAIEALASLIPPAEEARDAVRYRCLRHSLSGQAGCSHTRMPRIENPFYIKGAVTYLPHGLDQALDTIINERAALSAIPPQQEQPR